MATLRHALGCLLLDWPRLLQCLCRPRRRGKLQGWALFGNRDDALIVGPEDRGVICACGDETRNLHLCHVFPLAGRWLLARALRDWPLALRSEPAYVARGGVCTNGEHRAWSTDPRPEVSFLVGHRGEERIPLLLATLASIAGQTGVSFECLVVEQDVPSRLKERLPTWVRLIHTPPEGAMPYCRSWALNVAARAARGAVLICHDHDMVMPSGYAAETVSRLSAGFDAVNPKRFVFHLSAEASAQFCRVPPSAPRRLRVDSVMENLQGGGSIGILRDSFFAIGGFDEAFRGWGGEDNDFMDRLRALRLDPYGRLPLIHLWHRAQPGKHDRDNPMLTLLAQRRSLPLQERISRLAEQQSGEVARPVDGYRFGSGGHENVRD